MDIAVFSNNSSVPHPLRAPHMALSVLLSSALPVLASTKSLAFLTDPFAASAAAATSAHRATPPSSNAAPFPKRSSPGEAAPRNAEFLPERSRSPRNAGYISIVRPDCSPREVMASHVSMHVPNTNEGDANVCAGVYARFRQDPAKMALHWLESCGDTVSPKLLCHISFGTVCPTSYTWLGARYEFCPACVCPSSFLRLRSAIEKPYSTPRSNLSVVFSTSAKVHTLWYFCLSFGLVNAAMSSPVQ
mmetsp:Transcript_1904/g.7241  ORF Transcript_1904/g.7241 Transcript_1904/m.7241 type:complete len:246 (-) Transcript_1904:4165-4902(-)